MHKYLKPTLFGLGGMTLFSLTYGAVALISGSPLHSVAGFGMFFDAPEDTEEPTDEFTGIGEAPDPAEERVSGTEALRRNTGLLGTFVLPAPFTATEFRALEKELKDGIQSNTLDRKRIRLRELELEEWEKTLNSKYAELAEIRTKLEQMEDSIDLRQAELLRDENAKADAELKGWKALAKTFKGAKPDVVAKNLEAESPEDAALILCELGATEAGEILFKIEPATLRKEFRDAYRKASEGL